MHTLRLIQETTTTSTSSGVNGGVIAGIIIAEIVVMGLVLMGTFKKAGQPVWAAFVPIVNYYYLLKIAGRPGWWLILYFVPCVNIIILIIVLNDLSKSFGHGVGFTIGLIFLSIIFFLILSYDSKPYLAPAAASGAGGYVPPPPPPPAMA